MEIKIVSSYDMVYWYKFTIFYRLEFCNKNFIIYIGMNMYN